MIRRHKFGGWNTILGIKSPIGSNTVTPTYSPIGNSTEIQLRLCQMLAQWLWKRSVWNLAEQVVGHLCIIVPNFIRLALMVPKIDGVNRFVVTKIGYSRFTHAILVASSHRRLWSYEADIWQANSAHKCEQCGWKKSTVILIFDRDMAV